MKKMEIGKEREELEGWIEENRLAQVLLEKSSLDKKELIALLLYFRDENISFSDLASELGINRSGAWKRWKKGYNKIMESFYTLELGIYGGILDPEAIKYLNEDLKDYMKLAKRKGDKEAIRKRIEKRIAEMEKEGI